MTDSHLIGQPTTTHGQYFSTAVPCAVPTPLLFGVVLPADLTILVVDFARTEPSAIGDRELYVLIFECLGA
jgi:hypothetical protein